MIKLVALIAMVTDHVGLAFFPENPVFRIIGRLSMPLFAYAIARGFASAEKHDTKRRYVRNMAVCAVAASIPFSVMVAYGRGLTLGLDAFTKPPALDTCFTWTLALVLLCATKLYKEGRRRAFLACVVGVAAALATGGADFVMQGFAGNAMDYGLYGVLCPLFCYGLLFRERKPIAFSVCFAVMTIAYSLYTGFLLQPFAVLAIPAIFLLEKADSRLRLPKRFFYVFYPTHLAAIGVIAACLRI